jgi:hypothetical protein
MATLDEDSLSDASLIEEDDDEGGAKMDTDNDVSMICNNTLSLKYFM